MGVAPGQTPREYRRRPLQFGAALLFVAVAALWMSSPSGPPRALVALFDGNWRSDQPLGETPVLEVRVPSSVGAERLETLEAELTVAVERVAKLLVRHEAEATLFWLALEPGVAPERLEALVSSGASTLAFLPILDDGPTANAIRAFVENEGSAALRSDTTDPVSADTEEALIAGLEAMRDTCASCRPRTGESLVIERGDRGWSAKVATFRDPVFDGRYLTGADVGVSEFDDRPLVNLYLTPEGRRAFRDLSREIVGNRLAILIDGRVVSSPRVLAEIDSERIEVSMTPGSRAEMFAEANRVASSLTRRVGLPSEASWRWFTLPAASASALVLAWVVALSISALLGWFLARGIATYERRAGIERASPPAIQASVTAASRPGSGLIALRISASLVAVGMPLLVSRIPIPVLDPEILEGLGDGARAFSSIGAGGSTQLILGFLIVSAIVRLVPALERLRFGTFDVRRRLALPTGLIVFSLCALQAVALTPLYMSAELLEPGLLSVILLALSLATGTFLLWGAASFATLAGFGHGFSLLAVGLVLDGVIANPHKLADGRVVAVILLLGVVASYATSRALTSARRLHRLPLSGVAPVELLGVIQSLLLLGSLLFAVDLRTPQLGLWLSLAVFFGLTVGLSWLYTRPIERRALLAGLVPTVLVVILFVQGAVLISDFGPDVAPMKLAELLMLICVLPILIDVGRELVATLRYGRLSRVASTHDPDEADRLAGLLVAREIPAVSRAIRHRTLLRFLAPYLPIEVLVPIGDRRAALSFLREDELGSLAEPFGEDPSAQST